MIVMKFGGTSVGSAERIKATAEIIKSNLKQDPIIIVSAISGITSALLNLVKIASKNKNISISEIEKKHKEILKGLALPENTLDKDFNEIKETIFIISKLKDNSSKFSDLLISFGERLSSKIIAEYLTKIGFPAKAYNSYDIGMITDNNFGAAEPLPKAYNLIRKSINKFDKNIIPIITGFIGKDSHGQITTLSRGGSDYTASIIGAAIDAKEIQIWTDVSGIMTADPRIVANAINIPNLSFREAAELATFGAKVIHPKTIQPAIRKNIPVRILNSFEPTHPGTIIQKELPNNRQLTAISLKKDINLVKIKSTRMFHTYGFLAKLFQIFDEQKLSINLIATSEISVSLTFDNNLNSEQIKFIKDRIKTIGEIEFIHNKAIISIVGSRLKKEDGIISKITSVLAEKNINIYLISYGASEINVNFIVDEDKVEEAVKKLHEVFFEGENE